MDPQEIAWRKHEKQALAQQRCPHSGLNECECLDGPCDCFVEHAGNCAGCALAQTIGRNTAVMM